MIILQILGGDLSTGTLDLPMIMLAICSITIPTAIGIAICMHNDRKREEEEDRRAMIKWRQEIKKRGEARRAKRSQ